MKRLKLVCLFLCLVLTASVFSGCGSDSESMIYLNILSVPETLDPQLAQTDEELLICRNLYEGLLREDAAGKTVCGACESYGKEGLTYTFELRSDAKWSNGEAVTADDFVYAFSRAVSPAIASPFASRLECIKNAQSVMNGSADASSLGVTALSDRKLKIELAFEDEFFEQTLTTPVCMPCNRLFLESCEGKYGRDIDCVISNGSYSLKRWRTEEFGIRLVKNEDYSGDFTAKNAGITVTANTETPVQRLFSKDSVDCAFVDNRDIDAVGQTGANCLSIENICWFMTVGKVYTSDIRAAFLSSVSVEAYKKSLQTGFSPARSIYPGALNQDNAREAGLPVYDIESARAALAKTVKQTDNKVFPPATMYYYPDDCMLPVTKAIAAHFQQNLSAFVNISAAKHPDQLKEELKSANLQFAVFPVKAVNTDAREYLLNFGGFGGVGTEKAQEMILSDKTILPVCFENTNFCHTGSLEGVIFKNRDGYIDFSLVSKK